MHTMVNINRTGRYLFSVGFMIHHDKNSEPLAAAVQLEQAFPDRLTATHAVLHAMTAHMEKRYNLGKNEFTVEEKP